jgi:hypothetical protein
MRQIWGTKAQPVALYLIIHNMVYHTSALQLVVDLRYEGIRLLPVLLLYQKYRSWFNSLVLALVSPLKAKKLCIGGSAR